MFRSRQTLHTDPWEVQGRRQCQTSSLWTDARVEGSPLMLCFSAGRDEAEAKSCSGTLMFNVFPLVS